MNAPSGMDADDFQHLPLYFYALYQLALADSNGVYFCYRYGDFAYGLVLPGERWFQQCAG
jgi:hypothetical protein